MPPLHPSSPAEDRLALLQTHDDAVIAGSRNRLGVCDAMMWVVLHAPVGR